MVITRDLFALILLSFTDAPAVVGNRYSLRGAGRLSPPKDGQFFMGSYLEAASSNSLRISPLFLPPSTPISFLADRTLDLPP